MIYNIGKDTVSWIKERKHNYVSVNLEESLA